MGVLVYGLGLKGFWFRDTGLQGLGFGARVVSIARDIVSECSLFSFITKRDSCFRHLQEGLGV